METEKWVGKEESSAQTFYSSYIVCVLCGCDACECT